MTKSMHVTWDNRLMTIANTLYEESTRQIQLKDQAADDKKKSLYKTLETHSQVLKIKLALMDILEITLKKWPKSNSSENKVQNVLLQLTCDDDVLILGRMKPSKATCSNILDIL